MNTDLNQAVSDNLIQLQHEKLRAEVLNYMIDHDDDPIELLKTFAGRLRELIDCDQVIYRDLEETRIMVNSPAIEKSWSVPIEYCEQCEHFDAHHPMYAGGYTEMENCQEGWQGIPVYHDCPIKSSLTRIVYCDGEIAGYLAIHYVQNYHKFTDLERFTVEEFTRILSISLSRYAAKKENRELRRIRDMQNQIEEQKILLDYFVGAYSSAYYFDLINDSFKILHMNHDSSESFGQNGNERDAMLKFIIEHVHPDDREIMLQMIDKKYITAVLRAEPSLSFTVREIFGEVQKTMRGIIIRISDEFHVAVGFMDITENLLKEQEQRVRLKKALDDANRAKEQIAQQGAFTKFFLEPYMSAYYVGFDDLSCQIYKRTTDLEAAYPIITDYVSSLTDYINNEVHPDDRERFLELIRPTVMKNMLSHQNQFSFVFRTYEGKIEKYIRFQVIRGADEDHAAFGFRDITEEVSEQKTQQKQMQDALLMAQSANRAKTSFLNNMSHDIRTPMNAILGYTTMAQKHIRDKKKVEDCLEKTQQAGSLLLALINSVLDVSRIESGSTALDEKPGDVMLSFSNIESTLREAAAAKNIRLNFSFGEISDRYVYADFGRCIRVFTNLISNSIKYTAEGGSVNVRCEQLSSAADGRAYYGYTIEDNGIGMSEKFQEHMFDAFTREYTSTTSGIQGTGLGLPVCKTFVEYLGGEIDCDSRQGEGTVFTVTLPFRVQEGEKVYTDPVTGERRSAEKTDEETTPAERKADFKGKRVLLVEDNEFNREIAAELLEEEGFIVDEAEDGTIAVSMAREIGPEFFNFILMDIQMPVMNGFEATRQIRRMPGGDKVPIIALSANAFEEDVRNSLSAGMNAHVAKPIDIGKLKATLAKYL